MDIAPNELRNLPEVSKRVAVMYASKVVEYGDVNEIFYNPKHPYTIGLLNSIPKLSKTKSRLATIEGNVPPPTAYPKGCHFCTRCTFVIDKCWTEPPPAVEVEPGHISLKSRLFLYFEIPYNDLPILSSRY